MKLSSSFLDYYRCPEQYVDFRLIGAIHEGQETGYFRFGPDVVCYGRCVTTRVSADLSSQCADSRPDAYVRGSRCMLPFDPTEIVDNLRRERYVAAAPSSGARSFIRRAYYQVRPYLPVSVRKHLQRLWLNGKSKRSFPSWPVDCTVDRFLRTIMSLCVQGSGTPSIPFIWFWPDGKSSAAIVTHDVEASSGLTFCDQLMNVNDSFGIKASFQIIPEMRYAASDEILSAMRRRGHEINVHDLKHDGYLFSERDSFLKSAQRINAYAEQFKAKGFRSGVLYRNVEWYDAFSFSYDMSVPNTACMDPQPGGCCTVMPYFIGAILEIPVTTTQDYSIFHILGSYSIDLWLEQIEVIMGHHGLISFIVHPDYLQTNRAMSTYKSLLRHLAGLRSTSELWMALPGEIDSWWRERNQMRLVWKDARWVIEGAGADRARIAYAILEDGRLRYSFEEPNEAERAGFETSPGHRLSQAL